MRTLPALITDNIGDAPLTVSYFSAMIKCLLTNHQGLDIDTSKNYSDSFRAALQ